MQANDMVNRVQSSSVVLNLASGSLHIKPEVEVHRSFVARNYPEDINPHKI